MAIIPQNSLFVWENEINDLRDLDRLKLVLETMPDEMLMEVLEGERKNGRDDFPVRAMWNGVVAGFIFGHPSLESLLREFNRNVQLRYICGFGNGKIPRSYNYTRFIKKLYKHRHIIEGMFSALVAELTLLLPDFGERLALDSKSIPSFAKRANKKEKKDGRRDNDADLGIKEYNGVHKDGTLWEKVVKCFGYKLHLIVDSKYELPVFYEVTKASRSDVKEGEKMLESLSLGNSLITKRCDYFSADKAYDSGILREMLYGMGIHPIIDTRKMWQDEKERPVFDDGRDIYYKESGDVYCYGPSSGKRHLMTNNGYDKERDSLRKGCAAKKMGIDCPDVSECPYKSGIRIPLDTDRRVFTSIDRTSYKWAREYKMRTSVERVNSRLDVSFGFENHTIRGIDKMRFRCSVALIIMLSLAVGRIRQKQPELMRSLVKIA